MIRLEVTDDGFDLDPLFQGLSKPGLLAVWMRRLPLLGNGYSLDTPPSAAVLLLLEGLIKTSIIGDLSGTVSGVLFDSRDHAAQSLHISNAVLILRVRQDQTIVILREGNDGAELTIGMALPLLDDGDIGFMQRVYPVLGGFTGENQFRLIDDSLPERYQAIEFPSRFLEASTVKAVRYPGGLLYYMMGHLFEFLDRLFPAFRVFPVELLDPKEEFLSGSAISAKWFPKGYLLANPFDLLDDFFSNPVQEVGIRRISNVLWLGSGIYRYPFGLYESHVCPGLQ